MKARSSRRCRSTAKVSPVPVAAPSSFEVAVGSRIAHGKPQTESQIQYCSNLVRGWHSRARLRDCLVPAFGGAGYRGKPCGRSGRARPPSLPARRPYGPRSPRAQPGAGRFRVRFLRRIRFALSCRCHCPCCRARLRPQPWFHEQCQTRFRCAARPPCGRQSLP
jgi:hypothetical protein